jgi:hypothetical protein
VNPRPTLVVGGAEYLGNKIPIDCVAGNGSCRFAPNLNGARHGQEARIFARRGCDGRHCGERTSRPTSRSQRWRCSRVAFLWRSVESDPECRRGPQSYRDRGKVAADPGSSSERWRAGGAISPSSPPSLPPTLPPSPPPPPSSPPPLARLLREARAGQGGRSGRPFLWCRERGRFIPLGLRPSRVGSISRRHRSHREPGNEGALPLLSCESRRSALMNRDQGSSRFPG